MNQKTNKTMLSALALGMLGTGGAIPATAAAYGAPYNGGQPAPVPVQTTIEGYGNVQRPLTIPQNGSNCDPRVVAANLAKLRQSGILQSADLTVTVATGHCYGMPCNDQDMQRALAAHCAKAEKLAEIVQVTQKPVTLR